MKLEVGMYVRTKEGFIAKIEYIDEDSGGIDCDSSVKTMYEEHYSCLWGIEVEKLVVKARHNIIDLIEPMDLMYIDISPDDCGGIVVPRVAETLNELKKWKKRFNSGECILKDIVTREQLESMSYKVD